MHNGQLNMSWIWIEYRKNKQKYSFGGFAGKIYITTHWNEKSDVQQRGSFEQFHKWTGKLDSITLYFRR